MADAKSNLPERKKSLDVEEKATGIPCPGCGGCANEVVRTDPACGHITRRRECSSCGTRFTTVEKIPGVTGISDGLRQLAIGQIREALEILADSSFPAGAPPQ
jgi:hypothetical protein